MSTAYFTVGCSASGKSTWAKTKESKKTIVVDPDEVRRELLREAGNYIPGRLWVDWNFKDEKNVTLIIDEIIKEIAERGFDVIFSDTWLNKDRLNAAIKKMQDLGYETEVKYFPVPDIDVLINRDRKRIEGVGEKVIKDQWKKWLELGEEVTGIKPYKANKKLPYCIVVDIDGTVANMNGKRGPFDWGKVGQDLPRHEILDTVRAMTEYIPMKVVFLSGRDSVCWEETEKWLDEHFSISGQYPYELYMRTERDYRKDREIKDELFRKYVEPKYNVLYAIDDRLQMVNYWNDIGVTCISVGSPYDNF